MKTPSSLKNAFYSALVFFGTLLVLSAGYAAYSLATETSGGQLTADKWNTVINSVNDLDSRVSGATSGVSSLTSSLTTLSGAVSALQASAGGIWSALSGNVYYNTGNVGIGTSTP